MQFEINDKIIELDNYDIERKNGDIHFIGKDLLNPSFAVCYAEIEAKRIYNEIVELKNPKIKKDWTGNSKTAYAIIGASNHSDTERQIHDYYATEPRAIDDLLSVEIFDGPIWEPACGEGHLSERLIELGHTVISTDLIDRKYKRFNGTQDFFLTERHRAAHIITNPPYNVAQAFVEHALKLSKGIPGAKVAMFMKLTFLETKGRYELFKTMPPKVVYVYAGRRNCGKNGDFTSKDGSAVAYAWYVWENKPHGEPVIRWIF